MIKPKVVKSRIKIWRLDANSPTGYTKEAATLYESINGNRVEYDRPLLEKEHRAHCDVCFAKEQGYACDRLHSSPGPYEEEGGCMDCQYLCRKPPIHIGVRNYCKEHWPIMARKMGLEK